MNKMAQRMIRTGLLDSEKINSLSDSEQMFFVRLMLIADDAGHCDARPVYVRSKCYPVTSVSVETVSKRLSALCKSNLIRFYNVDGKDYIEIINFGQRLRTMRYAVPCPQTAAECPHNDSKLPPEEKRREEEGKEDRQAKPSDPRFKTIIEIFFKYYEHITKIKYIPHAKDFAQLKNLLAHDGGQTTTDLFIEACRTCRADQFHAKNFSLGYVAANYSKLISMGRSVSSQAVV